jgi:hypothetical protein
MAKKKVSKTKRGRISAGDIQTIVENQHLGIVEVARLVNRTPEAVDKVLVDILKKEDAESDTPVPKPDPARVIDPPSARRGGMAKDLTAHRRGATIMTEGASQNYDERANRNRVVPRNPADYLRPAKA